MALTEFRFLAQECEGPLACHFNLARKLLNTSEARSIIVYFPSFARLSVVVSVVVATARKLLEALPIHERDAALLWRASVGNALFSSSPKARNCERKLHPM